MAPANDKVELPTVSTNGRKGLLGKLAPNRKSRAPQPPLVKRTHSDSSSGGSPHFHRGGSQTLPRMPRGERKTKKINASDISGPVVSGAAFGLVCFYFYAVIHKIIVEFLLGLFNCQVYKYNQCLPQAYYCLPIAQL